MKSVNYEVSVNKIICGDTVNSLTRTYAYDIKFDEDSLIRNRVPEGELKKVAKRTSCARLDRTSRTG